MTPRWRTSLGLFLALLGALSGGCATIRVTDPARTATEQFLLSQAASEAIEQLSAVSLRDRKVFIDTTFLNGLPPQEQSFLIGELRARLLLSGVRLVPTRDTSQIVLEMRSGGIGVDRIEFLLGIPATYIPGSGSVTSGAGIPLATPELAIVKRTTQKGYASIAYVAYWLDSGEVVASSGPYIGRTLREDYWFFGIGPRTVGNIPTVDHGQ